MPEVGIGGEQDEVVRDAHLSDQSVDRRKLDTRGTSGVAERGRGRVVVAGGLHEPQPIEGELDGVSRALRN
jgi:hypothetical protein